MAKIAINKGLLKEYGTDRTVYMQDGDQFQIQLFNPETCTVGANVVIEGESIGGLIVLRPGERVWLERYVGTSRKFKFSTYEIDGSDKDAVNAIRENGTVKVEFFKEWKDYSHRPAFIKSFDGGKGFDFYHGTGGNGSAIYLKNDSGNYNPSDVTTFDAKICQSFTSCCCDAAETAETAENTAYYNSALSGIQAMETGKVGKGDWSSQQMNQVDANFFSVPFHTETMRILPRSRKPVGSRDLAKMYCPYCGRKVKTKFRFCPFCGKEIE